MADPLGISASIIAVLQLTTTVIQYINDVKEAPQERLRLRDEISSASWTLHMLRERLDQPDSDSTWLSSLQSLDGSNGPINRFKQLLEQVASKLAPRQGKNKMLKEFGRTLAWPFKKEDIKNLLSALERQKSMFHLALQNDNLHATQSLVRAIKAETSGLPALTDGVAEIIERVEELHTSETISERRAIIKWLSPLNFFPTQDDFSRRREQGTGEWFLESARFKAWRDSSGETLWCPGIPGAGKTLLTSTVMDHLRENQVDADIGIACIYCNYKEQDVQTPANLIASIWMQLVLGKAVVNDDVKKLYKKHIDKDTRPNFQEVLEILKKETVQYRKLYVIIDALDECTDDFSRETLVEQIRGFQPKVNLMVTSRVLDSIARIFAGAPVLEISASPADVRAYVAGRVSRGGQLSRHVKTDLMLFEDIKKSVGENAQGMFLLAQLHMDSLVSKRSPKAVRQTLNALPKDLDTTYEEAMSRIEDQNDDERNLAEQVLLWISFAVRPLMLTELCEALAVEPETRELDHNNMPDEELLTSVCAGLVVIDKNTEVVRLVHYSAQEYFKRIRSSKFPTAQTDIARICLTYLLFDDFKEGPTLDEQEAVARIRKHDLLYYAATNWGRHARGPPEQTLQELVLRFLASEEKLTSSVQITYFLEHWYRGESQRYPRSVNGLHTAAHFGLEFIVNILLAQGSDIAAKDSDGENALHKAAEGGHEAVVRLLLKMGADIHAEYNSGWTALHKAATGGNRAVVLLLLENGAGISFKGLDGRTALHFAAEFGNEEVASALLGKGADIEAESVLYGDAFARKFHSGRTPLHWAAANGYTGLVRLFIEHGADVNAQNSTLRTPLHEAIMWGHTTVVETLLKNGAFIHCKELEGWTPLHEAAWRSPARVTELLLERAAEMDALGDAPPFNIDVLNNPSQGSIPEPFTRVAEIIRGLNTPLHLAVTRGDLDVFEILRQRGASLSLADVSGLMPIHMAAIAGWVYCLEALLDAGVGVDGRDMSNDETALHKASRRGFVDCVQLLLDRGADINAKNRLGQDAREISSSDQIAQVLSRHRPGPSE